MLRDAHAGDGDAATVLYFTHHHDVLEPSEFQRLFGVDRPDLLDLSPLLSRLALVRLGMYPEQDDSRMILDYSIDPDTTNYLLSVSFNAHGQAIAVNLES